MMPFLWLGTCHITRTEELVTSLIDTLTGMDGTKMKTGGETLVSDCMKDDDAPKKHTSFVSHNNHSSTGSKTFRILDLKGNQILGKDLKPLDGIF